MLIDSFFLQSFLILQLKLIDFVFLALNDSSELRVFEKKLLLQLMQRLLFLSSFDRGSLKLLIGRPQSYNCVKVSLGPFLLSSYLISAQNLNLFLIKVYVDLKLILQFDDMAALDPYLILAIANLSR